eukprot:1195151-Prorocentrum_minimum.AAC.4
MASAREIEREKDESCNKRGELEQTSPAVVHERDPHGRARLVDPADVLELRICVTKCVRGLACRGGRVQCRFPIRGVGWVAVVSGDGRNACCKTAENDHRFVTYNIELVIFLWKAVLRDVKAVVVLEVKPARFPCVPLDF